MPSTDGGHQQELVRLVLLDTGGAPCVALHTQQRYVREPTALIHQLLCPNGSLALQREQGMAQPGESGHLKSIQRAYGRVCPWPHDGVQCGTAIF